jgi:pimeloyl-ACP methyl ester carboxylesterase
MMLFSTVLKGLLRAVYGEPPDLSADREGHGLVLVADGVGGLDLCGTGIRYVMGFLQLPYVVRVVPWGHRFGSWHADLTHVENRDAWARAMADEVLAFRAAHPEAPVFVIGKSGGTGVAVKALEHLPENAIERLVLLSSALSPDYDLSRALSAVRRGAFHFWSPFDVFVLGAGTRVFGTIDRKQSVSAGLVGFRPPRPLTESARAQYAKLHQVRWRPAMARTGYLGGHVGPDSPAFLRKYVVPLLRADPETHGPFPPVGQSSRPGATPIT